MSPHAGREEGRSTMLCPLAHPWGCLTRVVPTACQMQDSLLLPALCFAGQSQLSKASTDALTSGTDVANSCGVLFGQDSGETPKGSGSPLSFTPPHAFFHVLDTNVHPDTTLSVSGVSRLPHQHSTGQPQTSDQPAAK